MELQETANVQQSEPERPQVDATELVVEETEYIPALVQDS
jgi:hypothetical protein